MNDYLKLLEQYKDYKDVFDLIEDITKLRMYYSTGQYDKMQQHIDNMTRKYSVETFVWNTTYTSKPTTVQQSYLNAENFLRLKGFSLLLEKGIKFNEKLTSEELDFIKSTIKPIA